MTLSITLYACTTKTDFTICGGSLFIIGAGLLGFGLMFLFTSYKYY